MQRLDRSYIQRYGAVQFRQDELLVHTLHTVEVDSEALCLRHQEAVPPKCGGAATSPRLTSNERLAAGQHETAPFTTPAASRLFPGGFSRKEDHLRRYMRFEMFNAFSYFLSRLTYC